MPPHPLTNFEIQKYYQNDLNLMEFFQEIIFMKKKIIKDGTYVINLDEYADVGTHWIVLLCRKTEIVYFDTQPARDVPGTSPEGLLKVLTSGTSKGPSGDP